MGQRSSAEMYHMLSCWRGKKFTHNAIANSVKKLQAVSLNTAPAAFNTSLMKSHEVLIFHNSAASIAIDRKPSYS